MSLVKILFCSSLLFLFISCKEKAKPVEAKVIPEQPEKTILALEKQWLDAEFKLDTASIAGLLHPRFISINGQQISGKQEELAGIYKNIASMQAAGIFLDSLKLEDTQVRLYDSTAIATFIVHTFKKDKGKPAEKRTRFYDVWIKRLGKWKAVSSQGTVLPEPKP